MTAGQVDEALSALARCSAVLIEESDAEEQRMEELNELSEARIQQYGEGRGELYDAEFSLLSVRLRLSVRCANEHRDAARKFVCWWVDAAVTAWRSAVHGTPVPYARLGAAAPQLMMHDDDLAVLPSVDDRTRTLVELGAFLGASHPGMSPGGDDLAGMATELASRSGLSVRRDDTGRVEVVDDIDPEGRRRRLWGDHWLELGIPTLPGPGGELDVLLERVPGEIAERLLHASRTVIGTALSRLRLSELEDTGDPWTQAEKEEYGRLSARHDRLTRHLADYAQAVTESLPGIRASRGDRSGTTDSR